MNHRILLLFFALFFLGESVQAQNFGFSFNNPKKKKIKIPFEEYNNLIILPVKVNGLKMNLVLDTGVRYTILVQKDFSHVLNLDLGRQITLIGADRNFKMNAWVANSVNMQLGGISNSNESILVLEEDYLEFEAYFGANVQGIIGYDLFKQFAIQIDYDKKIVIFHQPDKFKKPSKYISYDLILEHTKSYITSIITLTNGDTLHSKLMLDSGASFPLLLDVLTNQKIDLPQKYIEGDMGRGLGGRMDGYIGKVSNISLPPFDFNDVITFYQNDEQFSEIIAVSSRQGILGGDMLSRFKVVIDYPHKKLYLKKGNRYKESFTYNKSGIILKDEMRGLPLYEVAKVLPDSPADIVDIQPGDIIFKVNGLYGPSLPSAKINEMFKLKHGKKIKVTLIRKGELLVKRFRLKDMI